MSISEDRVFVHRQKVTHKKRKEVYNNVEVDDASTAGERAVPSWPSTEGEATQMRVTDTMRFRDRTEAGQVLAAQLAAYANRPDVLVLACHGDAP